MTKSIVVHICALVTLSFGVQISSFGQGIALTGVGPVNRSMGGAGTAAPLDAAIGALYSNPGTISALCSNQLGFGVELLNASTRFSSNVGGSVSGDCGWSTVPSIGWVHHLDDSPVTVGLGVYGIGGFKNNLPNHALFGGPAFASAEILQIAPTVACQITDKLSIGISPTITTLSLNLDPLGPSVVTPAPTPGQGNRMHWGLGFQAGAYYRADCGVNLGYTFKSPQWVEELNFFTPGGTVNFNLDYPMIQSLGLSYTGFERWVFAIDGRYFDYEHTDGFREFGWRSVFAGAIGAQFLASDALTVRVGYNFNQNPIQSNAVGRNLTDPLIQDQNVATGLTYRFARNVDFNLAYVYLVNNSVTGPVVPGISATNEISAHSAIAGITVRY